MSLFDDWFMMMYIAYRFSCYIIHDIILSEIFNWTKIISRFVFLLRFIRSWKRIFPIKNKRISQRNNKHIKIRHRYTKWGTVYGRLKWWLRIVFRLFYTVSYGTRILYTSYKRHSQRISTINSEFRGVSTPECDLSSPSPSVNTQSRSEFIVFFVSLRIFAIERVQGPSRRPFRGTFSGMDLSKKSNFS